MSNDIRVKFKYNPRQIIALRYLNNRDAWPKSCWEGDEKYKVKEIIFGGAAGGGKSWLGCSQFLDMCDKYPDTAYFVARKRLTDLTSSTLSTFIKVSKNRDEVLSDLFKERGVLYPEREKWINRWVWKDKAHLIQFRNGSIIRFLEVMYRPEDPDYDRLGCSAGFSVFSSAAFTSCISLA